MRRLTTAQADVFRSIRSHTVRATVIVAEIVQRLSKACEHEDHEDDCPVCCLYRAFSQSEELIGPAVKLMDSDLQRGPKPKPVQSE